jgi:anthranilate synthase/aminodeoxychorismate synthase-like glutamine amidotransferase
MMKILVIDNFDSFTYNLVQYLGELGTELQVFRNNAISLAEIREHSPDGIVISPGPGTPDDSGITLSVIKEFARTFPIFGVCLGHQAIGQAYGGKVIRAKELMHGKTSQIFHGGTEIFANLPNPFTATRYHSLIVDAKTVPECLRVTAHTKDGVIMGLEHKELPVFGVQFHPESFLTTCGKLLLQNFLQIVATEAQRHGKE